ncbi:hypothetical protein [Fervidobacterium sp.]
MNRTTVLGVCLVQERRTSARGVPYALGWVVFRGMDRYTRLPIVGHGVLADRLEAVNGRPVVLAGHLRERSEKDGSSRLQVVVEELFPVEAPIFEAPLGHPVIDGYARAEVSGLLALDPKPLRGATGLRVAVRLPQGAGYGGTSFVNAVVLGDPPPGVKKGRRVYLAGALRPRQSDPERLTLYASEVWAAPGKAQEEEEEVAYG